ncbi:hypothetical protein PVAND_004164 [Polypedilum vanderplanki]|uniref:Uncharacterized protein n=1 Tax=Polypedilum vanderplanki TaxID=319348 RepID=A0A9J6BXC4_POLVA|nr:hypothetical protein PVAND_004164 [Polypedilum vanderplanki]
MEKLQINGHSIQFVDRKLWKREEDNFKLDLSQKLFVPYHSMEQRVSNVKSDERKNLFLNKRKCPEVIENKTRKRRILKRPKLFKNYFTDRQPLSIPCFEFPRLGEQHPFRGRQTICKFYDHNEIINDQLIQIKSAKTVQDFEKIINEQIRHNQCFSKNAILNEYYDTKAILAPSLRPFASETCLCTRDYYRLEELYKVQQKQRTRTPSPTSSPNAIKNCTTVSSKHSIDNFLHLASEAYDKCIHIYLNNLNDCTKRVEKIERQSSSSPGKQSLKTNQFNENSLTNRFNKLNINLDASRGIVSSSTSQTEYFLHNYSTRQSITTTSPTISIYCSQRAMSCNDSNNNNTESTNQLKDPPKIIFSDFSTTKQAATTEGDSDINKFSDRDNSVDKNCLAIPITSYCSEARPP